MAGPSNEAGHLNTGIAETSSHLEIAPEIEAVEATGDSDEVCGLERKECDNIMEHLKNNPGLVVKSLGLEGRIVLHVAVMAGETKKPKPPASKCTVKGLRDWYLALRWQDCKALMSLLQENPCLVAQTGAEGWTVLHAAARRGCLQLVYQVWNLFEENDQFVDEMSGVKVTWYDLLKAKCGPFEAVAQDMAWFTCPERVCRAMDPSTSICFIPGGHIPESQRFSSNAFQHLKDKLVEIMEEEPSKNAFQRISYYESNKEYNFVHERKELQFHYACQSMFYYYASPEYVKTVIDGCLELGPPQSVEVLTYLLQLHNAQGQTPVHLGLTNEGGVTGMPRLLELLPRGDAYKDCLNAKDVRGWTALHCAAATRDHCALDALLKDERVDANARTGLTIDKSDDKSDDERDDKSDDKSDDERDDESDDERDDESDDARDDGMTALHLAILHDDVRSVQLLLQCPRTNVNALFYRHIECGYETIKPGDEEKGFHLNKLYWSPLQLAAIMGLSDVVRALLGLKLRDIYDDGKLQNKQKRLVNIKWKGTENVSALLLASASGNPDTLRLFLDNPMFDPLVRFEGATALHYATNAMIPKTYLYYFNFKKVGRFLYFTDLGNFNDIKCRYEEEPKDMKLTPTSYLGRQACITMLLQAGVDIWEKDNRGRLAEPGPQAPEEAHLWWHEKMARETLEAKRSLNDAANAISVVAALVATASFVGPLQPPLSYEGDSVQDSHLSIRVFMVSNILSFYLAVASIMFAVVPSLPMPQEGIYAEWQRTRRTVGVAIFFLIMSVLGVLISFGAASNSVVSEHYSWQHVGLSFYSTLLGGFICILSISCYS